MSTTTLKAPAGHTATGRPYKRQIKKAVVLGAGIMGSRIALHFANIGLDVLLLDIPPRELTEKEEKAGLSLDSPQVKNRIVNEQFQTAVKSNPSPVYDKSYTKRVTLGNFDDDLHKIEDADWVVEVVVERLDIKQDLYERIEKHRKPGALITSNTSGIPMHQLTEGRSEDFQKHFCGTHFFNPPRYLPLLEIIPAPQTDQEVIDFLMWYGDLYLGKNTVLCKDTPAFIANRVGIYAIMDIFHLVEKYSLSVEEVDKLTGKLIGHPKSATFRTADLVGLDTAVKVAQGIYDNCPEDERREVFKLPDYIQKMVDKELFGDKTKQGFFKKTKNDQGKKEILSLDFDSFEYTPQQKPKSQLLEQLKNIDELPKRLQTIAQSDETYAKFLQEASYGLFAYVTHRIPEISDNLYSIDDAICAGFGWELGPFRQWDILGVSSTLETLQREGYKPAEWVSEMLDNGCDTFYKVIDGKRHYYDLDTKQYQPIPGIDNFIILDDLRANNQVLWSNDEASILDLGDGVLNIEFHSKANSLGGGVLEGINKALDMVEEQYEGLVIGNQGENFSLGANLGMVFMLAVEGEWDELEFATRYFQNTVMRCRLCSRPVVVAPHTMTLGGGCEFTMHSDAAQPAAETYMGLVEAGVGLIPAGGGTKEFALRMSDRYMKGDVETNLLQETFMRIAMAKVATSAHEAFGMNMLRPGIDRVSVNKSRQLSDAKARVLQLSAEGYTPPSMRTDIRVLGRTALGMVHAGTYAMEYAKYASEHDRIVSEKIGYVLAGGDLSEATEVSEQYLLDLEREAFLSLCGTQKTMERIQHTLQTGKPLRN